MLREAQVAKVLVSSHVKPRARYDHETIDDIIFFNFRDYECATAVMLVHFKAALTLLLRLYGTVDVDPHFEDIIDTGKPHESVHRWVFRGAVILGSSLQEPLV